MTTTTPPPSPLDPLLRGMAKHIADAAAARQDRMIRHIASLPQAALDRSLARMVEHVTGLAQASLDARMRKALALMTANVGITGHSQLMMALRASALAAEAARPVAPAVGAPALVEEPLDAADAYPGDAIPAHIVGAIDRLTALFRSLPLSEQVALYNAFMATLGVLIGVLALLSGD